MNLDYFFPPKLLPFAKPPEKSGNCRCPIIKLSKNWCAYLFTVLETSQSSAPPKIRQSSRQMENQTGEALANQYKEWDDEDLAVIFTDEVPECQGGSRLRLVGKLFSEREINKKSISGMINGAWSHFCEPVVQDLPRARNLFIFVFDTPEEKEKAWAGRPWQVSGCMLQLKQYEETIRPQDLNFELADFWVQVHGIPDHRRTINNIESAVAMFKSIHSIDMRGLNPERYMEFIRVHVQVDLSKPLPPGSYFCSNGDREWLGFRYEKLYSLCYYCGKYGHNKQECSRRRVDAEARVAGPPEGRFTPWMKAGTRASRPPPPPRGRIISTSPADAGSSSSSPGFVQNQVWVPGMGSPGSGSCSSGGPTPAREGEWGMTVRGPPGFTPHPFPGAIPSPTPTAPHPASGLFAQRLQTPSPTQNMGMYGVPPAALFSPQNNLRFFSPSVARNLAFELNEGQWAGMNQAHLSQIQAEGNQALSRPNLNQVMLDLNQKMDLNRKPTEEDQMYGANYTKEDQQEPKKRKQGEALDFAGPYFTPGEGSLKPRNARIRIKGNKNKQGKGNTGEAEEYQYQLSNNETEAQVACKKPPQSE